jgi:DNA-binding LytR/AlgR family response regulator
MLRIIIVDDEYPAREELKDMLEEMEDIEIIAEFEDGLETIEFLQKNDQADVVFLDIRMRHKDGIVTAWEILQLPNPPQVVFITGYEDYAVKAFELNAVDYILKPYSVQRLEQTISKLRSLTTANQFTNGNAFEFLRNNLTVDQMRLFVWVGEKMVVLHADDIIYIKTDEKGKPVIYSSKGVFMTRLTLKEIEKTLSPAQFVRTHRSYLVNLNKVSEVVPWFNNTYMISLDGYKEEQVPVARHYLNDFKSAFKIL